MSTSKLIKLANEISTLERLAAGPTYKDYVKKKKKDGDKPLSKEDWESRVLGKGKKDKAKKDKSEGDLKSIFGKKATKELLQLIKQHQRAWVSKKFPHEPEAKWDFTGEIARLETNFHYMQDFLKFRDDLKQVVDVWNYQYNRNTGVTHFELKSRGE